MTAGSSYCAAPVVLFCRHTAFFLFHALSLAVVLSHLPSPLHGCHHDDYKCELLPVLDSSASLSDTLIYACSPFIVFCFIHSHFNVTQCNVGKSQHQCSTIKKRGSVRGLQCQFTDGHLLYWASAYFICVYILVKTDSFD